MSLEWSDSPSSFRFKKALNSSEIKDWHKVGASDAWEKRKDVDTLQQFVRLRRWQSDHALTSLMNSPRDVQRTSFYKHHYSTLMLCWDFLILTFPTEICIKVKSLLRATKVLVMPFCSRDEVSLLCCSIYWFFSIPKQVLKQNSVSFVLWNMFSNATVETKVNLLPVTYSS